MLIVPQIIFPQDDISEYEKRLVKIAEQINELQEKIDEEEKKESTILSRLDKIGYRKELIKKEISLYNIRLEKTNSELLEIKKNIPMLKEKLDREKQSIEKTLVTIYKFGKHSFFEFMLQVKDANTFLSESKNLSFLAQHQDNIISDYQETMNKLKEAEENLVKKTEEISVFIQKARQKKKELDDEYMEDIA